MTDDQFNELNERTRSISERLDALLLRLGGPPRPAAPIEAMAPRAAILPPGQRRFRPNPGGALRAVTTAGLTDSTPTTES